MTGTDLPPAQWNRYKLATYVTGTNLPPAQWNKCKLATCLLASSIIRKCSERCSVEQVPTYHLPLVAELSGIGSDLQLPHVDKLNGMGTSPHGLFW